MATIIAIGANTDKRREMLGMQVGASEAEPFWTEFLRSLTRRGPRGVKRVISDAHEGLKAAVRKVISTNWQRCRVLFMRHVLVHAPAGQRHVVSALVATIFAQTTERAARDQWRTVADQLRERSPNEASIYRLVGAWLLEQNDEWALQRRYMTLEGLAEVGDHPTSAYLWSQPDMCSCQTGDAMTR